MEDGASLNWLAVIIGAVLSFLAGWLWFSPMLFGEKWAEGSRVELGKADDMPFVAMAAQGIALLLISTLIGLTAANNMLGTAIVAILGIAAFSVSVGGFVKKTNYAMMVDGGYVIAFGIIMIAVQAIL